MPDHYSPKHFLQLVPHKLLREFFSRRQELLDLKWDELAPTDLNAIYDAWHALPEASHADVERWFRAVWALANKEGLKTVIDEGHFHGLSLKEPLDQFHGIHEKILWVYLNHERVFLSAGRLNHADHLTTRYWRLRNDLPAKKPDITHPTRILLGQEISKYFNTKQGRGAYCTVEVYLQRKSIHYFFCYPSDYADTALVYDDAGKLDRQRQKAAFQVIFAYNELTGSLDVFVQGDKDLRHDLEEIFCRLVLKEKLPVTRRTRSATQSGKSATSISLRLDTATCCISTRSLRPGS